MPERTLILFTAFWFAATGVAALFSQPQVTAVIPANQSIGINRSIQMLVEFDRPLQPSTVNSQSVQIWGRWSGVHPAAIHFENGNRRVIFTPSAAFAAGEWVTVNLSKAIRDSAGMPMLHGYSWGFWAEAAPATMHLTEIGQIPVRQPGEGWIQTYGAYAGDINGDGFSDFLVPNERSNDIRVFLNDGQGGYPNFQITPLPGANRPSTNEGGDFNGDGFIDFAVGSSAGSSVHLLLGDGNGGFSPVNQFTVGSGVRGLVLLDADGDGDTDIITANRNADNLNIMLMDGLGGIDQLIVLEGQTSQETACAAADANNDGITDLFIAGYSSNEVLLWLGDGDGGFSFAAATPCGSGPWMLVSGDVNRDGNADVVSANSGADNVSVILGDGNGGLAAAVNLPSGANFPLAIDLGDLDGDQDLDMIVSNFGTQSPGSGQWRLWENDGSGNYSSWQDIPASTAASCAVFHDRDNDGKMDLTGIDEMDDLLILFRNTPTGLGNLPENLLAHFRLRPNFPNPFNPQTSIPIDLDHPAQVRLTIYDIRGKYIRRLLNQAAPAGTITAQWDARDNQGKPVSSGVYFYRLEVRGSSSKGLFSTVSTRKMIFMR